MNACACRVITPKSLPNLTGVLFPHNAISSTNALAVKTYSSGQIAVLSKLRKHSFSGRNTVPLFVQCRSNSAQPKQRERGKSGSLTESTSKPQSELTVGQKVAQAGKDATYTGVVIVGLGVTGLMFFAIGRELLSGDSPSGVYGRAEKMVKKNDDVYVALGHPLKSYGEMNRRGRRRHTSHAEYEKDGVKFMRMQFYIEGPSGKGTVHLEAKKDGGKYDFRYIFVETDTQRTPIIVLDNR